jgi:hypothetical protein
VILIPKNWAVFQHYKDRLPPWIKLHREILNDRIYMSLPIASKAIAPMMWLLASESKDGSFDGSLDELMFRLHITEKDYKDGVKPLIDKGFFIVASMTQADSKHIAIPETETETETERETKTETKKIKAPDGVSTEVWDSFVAQRKASRAVITETVVKSIQREANKAGWSLEQALAECAARGWRGFKADWVAEKQNLTKTGQMNQTVMSGLTRGLIGGGKNVKLLGF